MEYKTFTKAVEAKTIQVKCGITRDPMFYKDFKEYWEYNKSGWKKGKYRNIIHRIIHYKDFISRDGDFVWRDFLFYSSPIFPVKMKAWFSYKRHMRLWNEVIDANVDELTKQIDKEILDEVMKMVDVDDFYTMYYEAFENNSYMTHLKYDYDNDPIFNTDTMNDPDKFIETIKAFIEGGITMTYMDEAYHPYAAPEINIY